MRLSLVVLFACVALATCASHHTMFVRDQVPQGWMKVERACPVNDEIKFTIALPQQNVDQLESLVNKISTPGHPEYRNWLSIEQIREIVAPDHSDHDVVVEWLSMHGVTQIDSMGDALDVVCSVGVAESLFSTEFYRFKHVETGKFVVRSFGEYSVPVGLSKIIEMVVGISSFPVPHLTIQSRPLAAGTGAVVPQTCQAIYNMGTQTFQNATSTSQGVIEFQGQSYDPADLKNYATLCEIQADVPTAANTIGPNDPDSAQTEALLDIEIMAGTNVEATQWFWLESGNGWLYQFATHMFNTSDVPQVASMSYGWSESDQCEISPQQCQQLGVQSKGYVARVNTEFMKIGARGITLIASSGDSGANGRTNGECSKPELFPAFPGSSPYVTAVGATQLSNPVPLANAPKICSQAGLTCASGGTEVAVSFDVAGFASGGGFSGYEDTPSWQQSAVSGYLQNSQNLPPSSYYNGKGRGYPDIAALGNGIIISQYDHLFPVGGTSASAPIIGAVFSLLTQASLIDSGKPLGFINPLLYKMAEDCPKCFQDITVGDNICTEDGCGSSCTGFTCREGWDPVTGLGSPNYQEMEKYILAM